MLNSHEKQASTTNTKRVEVHILFPWKNVGKTLRITTSDETSSPSPVEPWNGKRDPVYIVFPSSKLDHALYRYFAETAPIENIISKAWKFANKDHIFKGLVYSLLRPRKPIHPTFEARDETKHGW
jgi:hypothetical protein